jgi:hypothetical protein
VAERGYAGTLERRVPLELGSPGLRSGLPALLGIRRLGDRDRRLTPRLPVKATQLNWERIPIRKRFTVVVLAATALFVIAGSALAASNSAVIFDSTSKTGS